MLLGFIALLLASAAPANCAELPFELGPAPATVDLRNMLREYVVRRSCAALDETAAVRRAAFESGEWQAWRGNVRERLRFSLGLPARFENPLNVRALSRHELQWGGAVENVLFESFPGWDVNGSVFLPNPKDFAPPWRAVVIPVGHSGKQMPSYQIPAQAFARLGYAAIVFDPPGMAGEKQEGNDHFNDGARCYLTGRSSNAYFVADALRCLDYLETRADIDMKGGAAMTGVSGGGCTTMMATLLDDRIKVSGPSCTAVPLALHPVRDVYAPCAETLDIGRFSSYDDVDVLAAALPAPLLLMAGAEDEVFKSAWSEQIAAEVKRAYEQAGVADKFSFFLDPGGHDYSLEMAAKFAAWMDKWFGVPAREVPQWTAADFGLLPHDLLKCHPRQQENMFTMNAKLARALSGRTFSSMTRMSSAASLIKAAPGAPPECVSGGKSLAWFHWVEELTLRPEGGIELPATYLYPAKDGWKGAALLYFDDRGRWTDLKKHGFLANATGFIAKETAGPAVLTVDLRGWGDTAPAPVPYDIAGWAGTDRWLAYVTAALGDPVFAMRVRDGLAALEFLQSRPEIDGDRVVVGGYGMGGVVALHVAAIDAQFRQRRACPVFMNRPLASFELLATSPANVWPHDCYVPGVLMRYDLAELAAEMASPVLVVNPLGADAKPLDSATIDAIYPRAEHLSVRAGLSEEDAKAALLEFVKNSAAL